MYNSHQVPAQHIIEILKLCIQDIYKNNYNDMINMNMLNDLIANKYKIYMQNNNNIENKERQFCVFTDGACNFNGKKNAVAGYAVVFPNNKEYNYSEKILSNPTNNRAEYCGIIKALEISNKIDPNIKDTLYIYTDSELLINSVTKWIKGWKKNNWMTAKKTHVLNKDLLIKIDEHISRRNVVFKHVKAHTNNTDWESYWNNIADTMAKETIAKIYAFKPDLTLSISSSSHIHATPRQSYESRESRESIEIHEDYNYKKTKNILSQFGVI
jgi:ribonuclease HI